MTAPTQGNDAQRELEQRALRNVRHLVDKIEQTDEMDARAQKRLLAWIIAGALGLCVAIAIAIAVVKKEPPQAIDVSKLPPVRAGPAR
ncbi:MAG TPA: hypothetical protein VEC19_06160 [Usitatibacter sp.]|nr:hypothetical protein [Usitatibacter sp.]